MKLPNWPSLERFFEDTALDNVPELECPKCGGRITYQYVSVGKGSIHVRCLSCRSGTAIDGISRPRWAEKE